MRSFGKPGPSENIVFFRRPRQLVLAMKDKPTTAKRKQ
ncbi:hypothetical protein l11_02020 [Neisseria weaveri LMG 5135]|nr:hypothetical protein l11_02020 [Neisseria weaveri LMG 5135]